MIVEQKTLMLIELAQTLKCNMIAVGTKGFRSKGLLLYYILYNIYANTYIHTYIIIIIIIMKEKEKE